MSIRGQGTKSIRKKLLDNSRFPVVGTKSIVFFHKATNKQQYIDVTSLVVPTGHVNPSPNELTKARLKDFENNLELVSSIKGTLMKPLSYEVVTNTTIRLKFEALEGEIFEGRLHNYVTNGTLIADVRTPNASGELLSGQTDFNLGEAIPITDLSSQWPIQLFRGNSGNPMLRNTGNADYLGDDTIGNYKMVDRGDGFCQVIRFNIAGDVNNETIMWASHGALGERPNLSVLQSVDKIHGIVDLMRQDLLDVTGNNVTDPTRYDNGVPTNSDLKAFGDRVLNNEKGIASNARIFSPTQLSDSEATKLGMKQYDITVTSSSGNWVSTLAKGIPYQMQDGSWRLKFNISGNESPKTNSILLSVSGVTFDATYQAVAGYFGDEPVEISRTQQNSGNILIRGYNGTTGLGNFLSISGDVSLNRKPTWAL